MEKHKSKLTGAINHLRTLHIRDIAESDYTKGPGGILFRVKIESFKNDSNTHIHIHVHMCMYIYIYR